MGNESNDAVFANMIDAQTEGAIRDALRGRGGSSDSESVLRVAAADGLSAHDLESIAESIERSSLPSEKLEAGRQHLLDAIGALKPTPLPPDISCESDQTPQLI